MRQGAKPGKRKAGTRRPVGRKSPKNDALRRRDLEKRLAEALQREAEALARETATAEILRVISSSPTDVQPVFDAIVASAVHLLGGYSAALTRLAGDRIELAALTSTDTAADASLRARYPLSLQSEVPTAQAIRARAPINIADYLTDPRWPDASRASARVRGYRSACLVPLLRRDEAIGTIAVSRREPGGFTDDEIALLQTFANQAVIAIENVRLFKELQQKNEALTQAHAQVTEALDQQTATSDILTVIASSPTDVEPVFERIVRSAAGVCGATDATLAVAEGHEYRISAHYGPIPLRPVGSKFPIGIGTVMGRTILEGRVFHVEDLSTAEDFPQGQRLALELGQRATLCVPLLREGVSIGTIMLRRTEAQLFTERQVALLQTFADQAVIAIENVRLFKELEARNRDLTEALDQQTATSEVLKVISRSTFDLEPVLDTLIENATRLCGAQRGFIFRADGELYHLAVDYNAPPAFREWTKLRPLRRGDGSVVGRVALERRTVQILDAQANQAWRAHNAGAPGIDDVRSLLGVPMFREGALVGVIAMWRSEIQPFTEKQIELVTTFADQAVIAIENVRLFTELQASNRELTTALDQQTATSDILKVISRSQTDVQPVFDAIADSALHLCEAKHGNVFLFDGALVHLAAVAGTDQEGTETVRRSFPQPPGPASATTRAILTRRPVMIPDVFEDGEFELTEMVRVAGFRSVMSIPMLREGFPIGAITVTRAWAGPFSETQVALLQTFADQAVIAIENARLFNELEGRNRDLTATSEILRVISSSPTDVQPVFEAIAANAAQLCGAVSGLVFRFDGQLLHVAASHNLSEERREALGRAYPMPPGRGSVSGRAILTRSVVQVPDVSQDPEYTLPVATTAGYRSALGVPMLRDGTPIGVILVALDHVAPFSDEQIALLRTFADQAVIAIENVRLFTELGERNRDLTTALDQQTATSEILRVISQSQTDVQPVFDTIVQSAVRLCDAIGGNLQTFDGERMHLVALPNWPSEAVQRMRGLFPRQPDHGRPAGRAVLNRAEVNTPDVFEDPDYASEILDNARVVGWRSVLSVPMFREGKPIGVISVVRASVGLFSDNHVDLLKTFADQAVIAIENVRLFTELEARTAALTRSVGELQALGEVSQAVSSTLELQTVLTTIVARAAQLSGADAGSIYEYDEATRELSRRAVHNMEAEILARPDQRFRRGEGALGQAVERREPVQYADISDSRLYDSKVRDLLLRFGYRALLAVPLLREDQIIGALVVNRKTPGEFPPETVELLTTFATQSALAIQNARLFREIADKSAQLEAASQHKSEFLANMSHELRTPLNAIIGFSEILAEKMFGDINEKQTEYLQDILESGRHLLSLINDILDLSKIEAGRMELELGEFDLPSAIDNSLILVRERASRRGIRLGSTIDERIGMIGGDERKVKQVLLNLLSNALKFTPEGGRIDIDARLEGQMAEVSVTDTGIGIAPEDQAAVFEEFRQVGTADKKAEGTGLGLALSRKFIELHGGRIWVKSELGAGSTFTFSLPLRR